MLAYRAATAVSISMHSKRRSVESPPEVLHSPPAVHVSRRSCRTTWDPATATPAWPCMWWSCWRTAQRRCAAALALPWPRSTACGYTLAPVRCWTPPPPLHLQKQLGDNLVEFLGEHDARAMAAWCAAPGPAATFAAPGAAAAESSLPRHPPAQLSAVKSNPFLKQIHTRLFGMLQGFVDRHRAAALERDAKAVLMGAPVAAGDELEMSLDQRAGRETEAETAEDTATASAAAMRDGGGDDEAEGAGGAATTAAAGRGRLASAVVRDSYREEAESGWRGERRRVSPGAAADPDPWPDARPQPSLAPAAAAAGGSNSPQP